MSAPAGQEGTIAMDDRLALARWANDGGFVPPDGESVERRPHPARSAGAPDSRTAASGGPADRLPLARTKIATSVG